MKIMVEIKVVCTPDDLEDAIELCDELWEYERVFDDELPEHEIEFGVTEWLGEGTDQ